MSETFEEFIKRQDAERGPEPVRDPQRAALWKGWHKNMDGEGLADTLALVEERARKAGLTEARILELLGEAAEDEQ